MGDPVRFAIDITGILHLKWLMPLPRPPVVPLSLVFVALVATSCGGSPPDVGSTSPPATTGTSEGSGSGSGSDSTTASMSATTDATGIDATSAADTAMEIGCGNGVIDDGEACDGEVLPEGIDCAALGFGEGTPGCVNCTMLDYTVCAGYMECGNGELSRGEECDGDNLGAATCDDFPNLTGRGLTCTDECLYDTSACMTCVESGESCNSGTDTCCAVDEVCAGLSPHCCVVNGLGLYTS